MHCTPVPDDNAQYEVSTYNHESKTLDSVGVTQVLIADVKVLHTYEDAMSHPDSDAWLEACVVGRKMVQCVSCLWRLVSAIRIHCNYHRSGILS